MSLPYPFNFNQEIIDIKCHSIGEPEMRELCEELKTNTVIKAINIYSDNIVSPILLADALRLNNTLQRLDITCNTIGDDGIVAIASALETNKSLEILSVGYNRIGDRGLVALADMLKINTSLQTLDVSGNTFGDESIGVLADALRLNKTLHALWINTVDIDTIALAEVCFTNTTLEWVMIGRGGGVGDRITERAVDLWAKVLETNTTLKKFSVSSRYIGSASFGKALAANKTLQSLSINGDGNIESIIEAVCINTTLDTLLIWENNIDSRLLAKLIETTSTLHCLSLSFNNINMEGMALISSALETNNSITFLTLTHNQIGNEGVGLLCQALETNTTLESINLWSNRITEVGIGYLCEILKTNTTLLSIDLTSNSIGESGVDLLTRALETNTTLLRLCIDEYGCVNKLQEYITRNGVWASGEVDTKPACQS